ncbi:hypothetical protein SRABI106_02337 [Rahnella aquatilis]|nr:hypothetical protein SRABI106_02337 [Rahnella aquatilis]
MKLKIERLRDFERDPSNNFLTRSEMMEAVKELIAVREPLKGDQVPVAYFAAAPDYGWDMFKNKEDAIATCQAEIDAYRDCRDYGWDDDVQRVCWGVVLQKAEGFDQQGVHTSNSNHTYQSCDYSLRPELFTAPQKPVVPVELQEDILRCVDDSMHGCNSLSAPDYAVRVAGWLAAGGVVKDGE